VNGRRAAWLAVVLGLGAACSDGTFTPQIDLAAAQSRWEAAGIMSYDFDLQVTCFCGATALGPVTISVRNGQPSRVVSTDSGTVVDSLYFQSYLTVDRLFVGLGRILSERPAAFTAVYDAGLGFPADVSIDGDAQVADDELRLRILSLRPIATPLR
jgi:hypothetical protein